jgi:hypothetical protein
MDIRSVNCSKCSVPLPQEMFNRADFTNCPSCHSLVMIRTFPALQKNISAPHAENILLDAEAGCFFHPQKKAVVACATCGRFLCSLCDIEFDGCHICASCLNAGKKKKKIKNLETHRVLYDGIALSTAILPLLFLWITMITAPISIYIAIRYWKAPTSIIRRTKVRFVFAILLSGLQLAGWTFVILKLIK